MPRTRLWARVIRSCLVFSAVLSVALCLTRRASAEKVIFKDKDWEIYTDGRVGGFVSWTYGDGFPQPTYGVCPAGATTCTEGSPVQIHDVKGGGWGAVTEKHLLNDPRFPADSGLTDQGKINMMRVRSGFIGNVFGFGVRNQITPTLKMTGYIQFWAFVESISRQKNQPNYADVRQGYAKVEGSWGSVLAGRTRALFSRGATDIDVLYAHRWGVGFPAALDSNGPTLGQIGFGVLGSGFAAGVIYATPVLAGLQLSLGAFDPIQLQGAGWFRTKYLRPEGELTFEQSFAATGKVVLFANGAIQKVYKDGYCAPPTAANPLPCDETAKGVGYGGRFEYGPVHVGAAGHYGKGLGLNYALEVSDASLDPQGNLRTFDGYYLQTQFVLGPFEPFAGAGIVRVFLTDADKERVPDPTDATGVNQVIPHSTIKNQMGINGGVVWHATPNLHIDLEYFRAQANWYLGEQQVIHCVSSGMTANW